MLKKILRFIVLMLASAILIFTLGNLLSTIMADNKPEKDIIHAQIEDPRAEQLELKRLERKLVLSERVEKYPHLGTQLTDTIISNAKKYIGVPYRTGGKTPKGFDCSGYVNYVLRETGFNYNIQCSEEMYRACIPLPESLAEKGDLVFFEGTYAVSNVSHVGIYLGEGRMIHAGNNGICYADITIDYWQEHFYSFGRLTKESFVNEINVLRKPG